MASLEDASFFTDGFVIRRGFFNAAEIAWLRAAIAAAGPRPRSPLDKEGQVFQELLFRQSADLQSFLSQPKIVDLLVPLIGPGFFVRKDQAVTKQPGGMELPWHQDNGYGGIRDGYVQLWVALDDVGPDSGGLWVLPGSHQYGILPHRTQGPHAVWVGAAQNAVEITARPGDVVVFSSLLLHHTGPNRSNHPRTVYVAEVMSLEHFDPYGSSPYWVIAEDGRPRPRFVRSYRGRCDPRQRLKYLRPRFQQLYWRLRPGERVRLALCRVRGWRRTA